MSATVRVRGSAALARRLERLRPSMRNRITRRALTSAARVVVRAAKDGAPRDTGLLRRSIDFRIVTGRSGVAAVVGPRSDVVGERTNLFGRIVRSKPSAYAQLVERGTAPRVIMVGRGRLAVFRHGGTAPRPFMRRAFESTSSRVRALIDVKIREGLRRYA